jgi:hypothetical protein
MPSARAVAAAVLLLAAAGCVEEPVPPDIDHMSILIYWVNDRRDVEVKVPEIPCTGTKSGFLSEDGEECESARWTLTIDGVPFETTPVKCTAAYRGIFGPVGKHCSGGHALAALPYVTSEDVEILASTGTKHTRTLLTGVRRTYAWNEEAPFQGSSHPGLARVQPAVELGWLPYQASFTGPDGAPATGSADRSSADAGVLALSLSPGTHINGVYAVHVQGNLRQNGVTFAVPLEGTLTVAE